MVILNIMWFKNLFFYFFLFNMVLCFSQNEEPTILWQDSVELLWSDFKDRPDPNTDVVAITASGMIFKYSVKKSNDKIVGFTTYVETIFYPEKSWFKPEKANKHILSHEQLHFNITELHSRKFRQQISTLEVSEKSIDILDSLHFQIQTDLKNMQNLYDEETDFSRNIEAQFKWQKQIQLELSNFSDFKLSN